MILTPNTDYSPATLKLLDFVVETEFVPFEVGSCICMYIYIYIYNLDISSEIVTTNFNIILFKITFSIWSIFLQACQISKQI
jgi:hypothetical protein